MNGLQLFSLLICSFFILSMIIYDLFRRYKTFRWQFRFRRTLNWLVMGFGYTLEQTATYNLFFMNGPKTWDAFGLKQQEYGSVLTIGTIIYSISMITNAFLVDLIDPKKMHIAGIFGAGISTLGFGLLIKYSHNIKLIGILLYFYFCIINFCGSFGSLCTVKINNSWLMKEEKGPFGCIFGCMLSYAYMLSMILVQVIIGNLQTFEKVDFSLIFVLTGSSLLLVFLLNIFFLKNRPTIRIIKGDIENIPKYNENKDQNSILQLNEEVDKSVIDREITLPLNNFSVKQNINESFSMIYYHTKMKITKEVTEKPGCSHIISLFKDKRIWIVGVSLFCFGMIRDAFLAWMYDFLSIKYNIITGSPISSLCALSFTIGSFMGSFTGAIISSFPVIQKNRVILSLIFFFISILMYFFFYFVSNKIAAIFFVGILSLSVYGIQGFRTTVAMDIGKKTVAIAAGILSSITNFGGAFSIFISGIIKDKFQYSGWIVYLILTASFGSIVLFIYWFIYNRNKDNNEKSLLIQK